MTICDIIANFMVTCKDRIASLPQIYKAVYESWGDYRNDKIPAKETIRAAIYKAPSRFDFKNIGKGVYLLQGETSSSLLINGDSRSLEELEDNSIDCIITDHPWEDKKAHKSGNQKNFVEYETFTYSLEDWKSKARVLKEGSFIAEFLPIESATNWEYLAKIKNYAKEAGFKYYASMIWRKAPEGTINNGRTTKGVEQIIVWSKGTPRRLAPKGKPYMTNHMLNFEIDIPIAKKDKHHQAEKPLALYEYLIEALTNEQEVCLDQFAGAGNLLRACVNKNRFGVAYELSKDFCKNIVDRFNLVNAFNYNCDTIKKDMSEEPIEILKINVIPLETSKIQCEYLNKVYRLAKNLLSQEDIDLLGKANNDIENYAIEINALYQKINELGYSSYQRPTFEILENNKSVLDDMYYNIDLEFDKKFDNQYLRPANMNFKYELQSFAQYAVCVENKSSYEDLNDKDLLSRYLIYIKNYFSNVNINRTYNLLCSRYAC